MAEVVAKVFAGFLGLAYVSGYLIVSAHLEALDIRNSGVTIVRAKYIWMGFLYLLPLLFLSAVTALMWINPPGFFEKLLWRFSRKTQTAPAYKNRYPYTVLLTTLLVGVRMILFTPRSREESVIWIFIAMLLLLVFQIAHRIELHQAGHLRTVAAHLKAMIESGNRPQATVEAADRRDLMVRCRNRTRDIKETVFYFYSIPVAGMAYYAAHQWWPSLPELPAALMRTPWADAFQFGTFAAALTCLHMQASTAFQRDAEGGRISLNAPSPYLDLADEPGEDVSAKRARWVVRTVIMMVLYFASIHGFAHLIYPLIPVERGGGRYATGTVVDVCMRPSDVRLTVWFTPVSRTVSSADFCLGGTLIEDAIVLEQEPDTLYIASVHDAGVGRAPTQACGLLSWHEETNGPGVLALGAPGVIGVRDKDSVKHFCASQTLAKPIPYKKPQP